MNVRTSQSRHPEHRPPEAAPIGSKGQRTRAALIAAARAVFAEKGYFETKLSDITERAGCSTGTLYTYFRNREDVLTAIIEGAQDRMLKSQAPATEPFDPVTRIERANREYIEAYQENADLMALMDEVSHVDAHIRELRLRRARAFFERNARSISELQAQGRVDASLDPYLIAQALSSMVSRLCFHLYVDVPDPRYQSEDGREQLIRTVSALWSNALGLSRPAEPQ
jgi:AcrR family transcriptional regulator